MMRPFFLLVLVLTLVSCQPAVQQPPNIIWIVAEDISPAWGAYGDELATTPNLDALAADGLLYRNAFANAPICAPARSTLVTGMYAPSLGTEHLRSEIPRSPGIGTFPEYLREAGYFVTNSTKTDYNFSPEGIWDYRKADAAPWRQRPEGQPFFSQLNYGMTHEGPSNRPERYDAAVADLPPDLFHDPETMKVPAIYPDTAEMRRQWARVYDLITVFDRKVGEILANLAEDGLRENTIIFAFGDHGMGMPGFKRWLNDAGMRVPLIIHVPEKYRQLAGNGPPSQVTELVGFADFAPTVLSLAGVRIPEHMQGQAFLGEQRAEPRDFIFGYRGRADDMYEVSRAIHTGEHIYVRHYMPYLPYIQRGRIFDDSKTSMRELRRLQKAGELPPPAERMWHPKPKEELYDLQADPNELNNLADSPQHQELKAQMHRRLTDYMVEARDIGILLEPEMMDRSRGSSPYEIAQDPGKYNVAAVVEAAELVGSGDIEAIAAKLTDDDSAVRFWAAQALIDAGAKAFPAKAALVTALGDEAAIVSIAAAQALCRMGNCSPAIPTLKKWLLDERPTTALYAARTAQLVGNPGCVLAPTMQAVITAKRDPTQRSGYKDFNYAAFAGWALEEALNACNIEPQL
jgi:arylsulfatase A-like enzyme